MKTVRFDDSISEKRGSVYYMDSTNFGEHYWARLVTICEAKTGRSWRVTVYGAPVTGRRTKPLAQRTWMLKEQFANEPKFNFSMIAHTALFMAIKTHIRWQGSKLVERWRESGVNKLVATGIQKKLNKKYGIPWLYCNESAQIDCDRWLRKAISLRGKT